MALPLTGPLSMTMIKTELGITPGTTTNLGGTLVRGLAGVPSGIISYSDLLGKSAFLSEFFSSANNPTVPTGNFTIADFSTGLGAGGFFYRGYSFTLLQNTIITALMGNANGNGTFALVLYEATSQNPTTPATELARIDYSVTNNNPTAPDIFQLPSPIALTTGKVYILAQGRESGDGTHLTVSGLNRDDIVATSLINTWEPGNGQCFRWGGGINTFINQPHADINNIVVALGFVQDASALGYSLPVVTTLPATVSNGVVTLSGNLTNTGFPTPTSVFIEWGTQSNVSVTGSLVSAGAPLSSSAQFSITLNNLNLTSGITYYYRPVAINSAGRVAGDLWTFQ